MTIRNTPHGQAAHEFALALVSGEPERAHGMLAAELAAALSPADLKNRYEAMVGDPLPGPDSIVDVSSVMDDWPGKRPEDLGWVYVSIDLEVYSEAISVVVTSEDGEIRIREIEWGRP